MTRHFVPLAQLRQQPTTAVAGAGSGAALTLAHRRGAATPDHLHDAVSAEAVLRAVRLPATPVLKAPAVRANHFDVDGFVGVWSLPPPALALPHEARLRRVATLGDFRAMNWPGPLAEKAVQRVCWLTAEEKACCYGPLGGASGG